MSFKFIHYLTILSCVFIFGCSSYEVLSLDDAINENVDTILRKEEKGDGRAIYVHSLLSRYGLKGVQKDQDFADRLLMLAKTRYHEEFRALPNGGTYSARVRDVSDDEINFVEKCIEGLYKGASGEQNDKACGSDNIYKYYKNKWDMMKQ